MSDSTEELHWFAFQVKPKFEASCSACLQDKGYEGFCPRYKVRRYRGSQAVTSEVPLFSQYVFCRCRWEPYRRFAGAVPILTTPGIVRVVGYGKTPVPIDHEEINAIRRVVDSDLAVQPYPYLRVGEKICVLSGPLKGTQGVLICEKGQSRLVISITMLQRSIAIELDRENVEPSNLAQEPVTAQLRAASERCGRSRWPR